MPKHYALFKTNGVPKSKNDNLSEKPDSPRQALRQNLQIKWHDIIRFGSFFRIYARYSLAHEEKA